MNKKQKKNLIRIIATAVMMIALAFAPIEGFQRLVLYMVPYLLIGYDILIKAFKGIKNRQAFDESLLMSIATIGALALAIYEDGDYTEAIAVMLFYQIGEWFQSYAVGKSRKNISDLMDIRPDYANIEIDGKIEQIDPDEVEVGTTIIIQPGEKVPIDGVVVEGYSTLNTSALTGESVPRSVNIGDEIISGCINLNGLLKVRTTKIFEESTASKILDLVENASSRKSKSENFITKFARIYTPAVVFSAIALALIPPLVRVLIMSLPADFGIWFYRALTFLVISCPCALVISIPLSFFAGLGGASREGILIKGSNYLETLSKVKTVVLDKTGTLTKGVFDVDAVHADIISETELLHLTAHVERYSTHPIAASLRAAYPNESDDCKVENVEEIAGKGIRAIVNGDVICVGNTQMMDSIGAKWRPCHKVGTTIHVAINGQYAGHVIIADVLKPYAKEAIEKLKNTGINRIVMLTGDSKQVSEKVAAEVGIDEYYSDLLPADKVEKLEKILNEQKKSKTAFVGDGINDAPVLSRADIGIAMGAMGSDAAIEAADVVLMDDDPLKISKAIKIAKKCMTIVKENIYFAIGVKFACLILGAIGIANMWLAIFADVGVMILTVINSIRTMFVKSL